MSALERSYDEIDHNLDCMEESPMPLAQAVLFGQEAREAKSDDLNISDQPIVEIATPPNLDFDPELPMKFSGFHDLSSCYGEISDRFNYSYDEDPAQSRARESREAYEIAQRGECWLDFLIADENNSGLESIVRFLQDHRVATNSGDESLALNFDLYDPVRDGHENTVRFLLDSGVVAQGPILEFAVQRRHEGIVRLLLDNGVDAKFHRP